MSNNCLYSLIKAADDSCAYAIENCNNQSIFPFTHYYFCWFQENWIILVIISPILFLLLFNFLARTVDDFLSPAVTFIAEYCKMSQTFAGVTLIAFANGIPDFLTAFLASSDDEGILIAVGSIFGATLTMTTVVVGAVILVAGIIKAEKVPFLRDLIFNGMSIIAIIAFALIGKINHYMSLIYCSCYIIYIIIVLINENSLKNQQKEINQEKNIEENEQLIQQQQQQKQNEEDQKELIQVDQEIKQEIQKIEENNQSINFKEMSFFNKFLFIYNLIFENIRIFTIPASSEQAKNKDYSGLHQLICPLAMITILNAFDIELFNIKLWILLEIVGFLLYIYHSLFKLPIIFLSFECVACSIIWCKQVIETLIDFILLIQTLTGISYSYLGMTFLAFGNSTCDFLVDTKLASLGYGLMALTGCFSGTVFNTICGFGGALLRLTWIDKFPGVIQFDLFRDSSNGSEADIIINRMNNSIAYCVIIFSLMNITMTSIIVISKKFKLTKNIAYYYFFMYAVFFIFITTLTVALGQIVSYLTEIK